MIEYTDPDDRQCAVVLARITRIEVSAADGTIITLDTHEQLWAMEHFITIYDRIVAAASRLPVPPAATEDTE